MAAGGVATAKRRKAGWAMLGGLLGSATALALVLQLVHGPWRSALGCGVVTGAVGGVVGLALIGWSLGRPIQLALAAMGAGFLFRVALVGAGLWLTLRTLHGAPLGFVAGFFPLFFAFVGLEAAVLASGRARPSDVSPGSPHHA